MTSPDTKAREIAEQIYQKLLEPKTSLNYSDPTDFIAAALREYGEKVKTQALDDMSERSPEFKFYMDQADAKGYRRGIEEAASHVSSRIVDWVDRIEQFKMEFEDCAKEIRSLSERGEK